MADPTPAEWATYYNDWADRMDGAAASLRAKAATYETQTQTQTEE